MRFSNLCVRFILLCLAIALIGPSPAWAEVDGGTAMVEAYLGWYYPDDPFENKLTGGVRGGYNFFDNFGVQGSTGYYKSDYLRGIYDYRVWILEASAVWYANPDSPAVFMLYGGPGFFFSDIRSDVDDNWDKAAFSMHGGMGLNIQISDLVYLRPDGRVRWIGEGVVYHDDEWEEGNTGSTTDFEVSLSIGFTIGRD